MEDMNLETMRQIQEQKSAEMAVSQPMPLDGEGALLAGGKRKTFDLPTNAVKVDPLR